MQDKLTVYFNKRTGSIKELCSGEQDMSWFGEEQADFEKVFDYIIVDYDEFIFHNFPNMEVKDNKLKMIPQGVPEKYT